MSALKRKIKCRFWFIRLQLSVTFSRPYTLALPNNSSIQAMVYSPEFTFSSGYPLSVLLRAELHLSRLRQFQAFLVSSAFAVSASSYLFASIVPLSWRVDFSWLAHFVKLGFPVLASVSNSAL